MKINRLALTCLLSLSSATAFAAEKIPAETFARHVEYSGAQLSPTGEYVSVITPYKDRRGLSIIKLSGDYDRSQIKFEDFRETISGAWWTDDNRLILEKARDIGTLEQPVGTGVYWAADADGTHQDQIFGYIPDHGNYRSRLKDEGWASYMNVVPGTQGEALFYFTPWSSGRSDTKVSVYRVDTHSGTRKLVEAIPQGGSVDADNAGKLRFTATSDDAGNPILRYRPKATDTAWTPVPTTMAGRDMGVLFFEKDDNHAIAIISDKGEPEALYRVDFAAGTRERLAGNDLLSVSGFERSGIDGPMFAVSYDGAKPKIDYIDPKSEFAQLHAGLMKLFPGEMVEFINYTKDSKKLLFFVYSDRHPGAYYVFDRTTRTPQMLFETMEWINPAKMAPMQPVEFKNKAGETIFGFYTAPSGKTGPQPLVVMPHGGPFGIHDSWGYDADVQFLANRGYGVLQVNFRGSGGRGEKFQTSTFKQWGTGIQDDIADGVRWAIANNVADAAKVCIYGASFGGYSALMNPIRNPGMYKCAIGYAGVYDLAEMYKSGDTNDSRQGRSYLGYAVGSDAKELTAQSPARRAEEIDVPVLLIHGKNDFRAPIDQYNLMLAAMDKAKKPVESLVKANEGHGFFDPKNQTEAYQKIEAFLLKYNPPN